MAETRQRWLEIDGTRAVFTDVRRFACGADLDTLPVLGELFRSVGKAQDFVASWSVGLVVTLREHPLAQIPARHYYAGGYSMMQIAAERGAALSVSSYARLDAQVATGWAVFSDRDQQEIVLAGAGTGRIFRIADDRKTSAVIEAEARDWHVGDRITVEGTAMCRQVQSVHGRLVTLVLSHSATEVFLRVAVATGLDEALDLADYFGRSHPSDRLRLASYEARDLVLADAGRRDAL